MIKNYQPENEIFGLRLETLQEHRKRNQQFFVPDGVKLVESRVSNDKQTKTSTVSMIHSENQYPSKTPLSFMDMACKKSKSERLDYFSYSFGAPSTKAAQQSQLT